MQITIKKNDLGNLIVGLNNVGKAIPDLTQSAIVGYLEVAAEAAGKGGNYPTQPAGSKYVRTGNYGDSFEITEEGNMGARLVNNAVAKGKNYTMWVGGDSAGLGQQAIHKSTGWPIIRKMVDAEVQNMITAIEDGVVIMFGGNMSGSDWIKRQPELKRKALARMGGLAAAAKAKRNKKGQFSK